MHMHMHMHMNTHAHTPMYACMHACTHTCTHARMHACTHMHTHAHAHACMTTRRLNRKVTIDKVHIHDAHKKHITTFVLTFTSRSQQMVSSGAFLTTALHRTFPFDHIQGLIGSSFGQLQHFTVVLALQGSAPSPRSTLPLPAL